MNQHLARIVCHYLEQIIRKANLKGFDEMRIEIEAAIEQDGQALDRRLDAHVPMRRCNCTDSYVYEEGKQS